MAGRAAIVRTAVFPAIVLIGGTARTAPDWLGSCQAVGRWVASFGLFALGPLFGPEAGCAAQR